MELWRFLGDLHPKLVQIPLVLLFVGLLFDLIGAWWKGGEAARRAQWAGLVTSGLGTVGLLFAFICGIYAEIWAGRAGIPQHPIELHELAANIASWGFVVLYTWRLLLTQRRAETIVAQAEQSRKWLRTYVVAGLCWYSSLALTGYLGGQLVFEYGAGVAGGGAQILTLSDLNTLAARQTDENLRYSEWMHHIFGWLTLGLAASLLAQAFWPQSGKRLRWIVPVFLLAGGIFLFFMADRDLYALSDPRQWRDREVQLHKTLATIMAVIGAEGLRRLRAKRSAEKAGAAGPAENAEPRRENSKLVAVLALIGGAMLFTHVHTVAPYANVAAGVYIAHVVMGLVALSIGAARVAQEYLPRWRRPLAGAFAVLMLIESVLLVSYNEGLPWYIGYGRYNRWGPEGLNMTIAPFGNFRAALRINEFDGTAIVIFRDRFTDKSVTLKLDAPPELLIAKGYDEISLPLTKSVDQGQQIEPGTELTGSIFRASAPVLTRMPLVSARLRLQVNGREEIGYFDPWVTPAVQAVPANELATYECPMHEGMRATKQGPCPLCGMEMVPIRAPRPAGVLHDPGFGLQVDASAAAETSNGLAARMNLLPVDDQGREVPLAIVHEQPMHVIIVSEDLRWFDHIHPVHSAATAGPRQPYRLNYSFPRAGNYVMFIDVTPVGDREQVFRVPLAVSKEDIHIRKEDAGAVTKLAVDRAAIKLVPEINAPRTPQDSTALDLSVPQTPAVQAELVAQPRTIYAGLHADLLFKLSDSQGRPLTDLSPYLGAMGHCVIISEDTREYIHSHPEQLRMPGPEERGGPAVSFHAMFPAAGRYRVWGQFKRANAGGGGAGGDKLVVAEFTVDVKNPPVPAGLIRFLLNESY